MIFRTLCPLHSMSLSLLASLSFPTGPRLCFQSGSAQNEASSEDKKLASELRHSLPSEFCWEGEWRGGCCSLRTWDSRISTLSLICYGLGGIGLTAAVGLSVARFQAVLLDPSTFQTLAWSIWGMMPHGGTMGMIFSTAFFLSRNQN